MSEYKLQRGDIAGFEVSGYKQKDGSIKIGENNVSEFPAEITLLGVTYTLERIVDIDVPESHASYGMCWGEYL